MYYGDRIIVDTRKYDVNEVLERYKSGMIIFPEKNVVKRTKKNKVIREMLEAITRGIPFPPVYASELQTGELLVLDKSERLRYLMEYLDNRYRAVVREESYYGLEEEQSYFSELLNVYPRFARDVLYTSLTLHVIEYFNPKYMHMQAGAFIEEWSASQEQSIRNILYQSSDMVLIDHLLSKLNHTRYSKLMTQYDFIYFLMFHMVVFGYIRIMESNISRADKYQLLEVTINELKHISPSFLEKVFHCFDEANWLYENSGAKKYAAHRGEHELKTKYLCFISYFIETSDIENIDILFRNMKMRKRIENCDMSYISIRETIDYLRREYL